MLRELADRPVDEREETVVALPAGRELAQTGDRLIDPTRGDHGNQEERERAGGHEQRFAAAAEEHYAPLGPSDTVPTAPVSLTLIEHGMPPTSQFGCGLRPPKIVWILAMSF